jgi:GxxExxY protein
MTRVRRIDSGLILMECGGWNADDTDEADRHRIKCLLMLLHEDIAEKVLSSFYKVYNEVGFGFLEQVYENALLIELSSLGLICLKQVPVKVYFAGEVAGNYFADILVENKVILELKAGDGFLTEKHELQLINYLRGTDIEVGLLLHFGPKPIFKRKIFMNNK